MRAFNEHDKTVIRQLLDARNSGTLSLHDFFQHHYFSKTDNRALILQVQGQYAVFFLTPPLFDKIDTRNEEIQSFLDLLALLQELKKQGYLVTYRVHPERIVFFQEKFSNPRPQQNMIILNDAGDYSASPDSIHDANNRLLFKGTYFHGDLFEFILNTTTGMMIIHKEMENLLEKQGDRESERTDKRKDEHDTKSKKYDPLTLTHLLLTVCMFLFLLLFFCFYYKKPVEQTAEIKIGKDSINNVPTSIPDSTIKTAVAVIPAGSEDSVIWRGVDISKWNGDAAAEIDPTDSISFIICKATEGDGEIDPDFDTNWQIIRNKKCILGAYHFYRTDDDPVKQAQHFLSTIDAKGKTDMVPIVDIEQESIPAGSAIDYPALQKNLLSFLTSVEEKCNCTPMIYTNGGFANEYLLNRTFNKYPLWLAAYTTSPSPPVPYAWRERGYKIWQKRNSYQLDSHVFDFDVFYGKKTDLYK